MVLFVNSYVWCCNMCVGWLHTKCFCAKQFVCYVLCELFVYLIVHVSIDTGMVILDLPHQELGQEDL